MRSRLLWRRSATALGTYASFVLGVLGTLVAARVLGPASFGVYSIVLVATSFFALLLDLTVEEALVKFGFRYAAAEEWGKLRGLFRRALAVKGAGALLAGGALAGLAPLADRLFGAEDLMQPLLLAALIPVVQAPESPAGVALLLRGRYDVRAFFLLGSQALKLAGIVIAASHGVTALVTSLLCAQALASAGIGAVGLAAFRRFPRAAPEPLAEDRRGIVRFVAQSSVGTGISSLRGALGTLVLGLVSNPVQVGFFRAAQAPQQAFYALSSPARLILLTEQTRDWERGARDAVFDSVRRYSALALGICVVVLPPLLVFMPELVRLAYTAEFAGASDAARIVLLAAALQLVFGWTKSFPISIGRPGLRTIGYALEAAVLIPLVVVLGREWGATGGAGAILGSTAAGCALWLVLLARLRREHGGPAVPEAAVS
ncbi:MAG: lipopolysaccharide biosynthesis protein [Gaiellaceae bacterium]